MENNIAEIKDLLLILEQNKNLQKILKRAGRLKMPNWYLGAGGIVQTVWNVKHGFDPENGIKDYDLVYYDASDISYEAEDKFIQEGARIFKDIPVLVEIKNQARVHLWYEKRFGRPIKQYISMEQSIATWPTIATCIGIRKTKGKFQVYAPFGLDDLFKMVVRANKVKITKEIYEDKVNRWSQIWPKLKVVSWDEV